LKRKMIFTLLLILAYSIFVYLPVPAIDLERLRALFAQNQFLALLDIFLGER